MTWLVAVLFWVGGVAVGLLLCQEPVTHPDVLEALGRCRELVHVIAQENDGLRADLGACVRERDDLNDACANLLLSRTRERP